ncbi:MAG: zinc ribbon domain-containing protein [Desulfotalea sp.]
MPIHDYICKTCDHKFEHMSKNSAEKVICPKCKSEDVSKQLSAPVTLSMGGDSCPPSNSPFQ